MATTENSVEPKRRGPKAKAADCRRVLISVRLPPRVINLLLQASDENGTTLTEEVEARLVETLISDRILSREEVGKACGAYAAASAALL